MSNQNKKMSNLFLGTEFGKFMFFLSNVHKMLQQVLTEEPKSKKRNSGLILYSYIPQNLEYDAEI
jgi:hypothetical protein